jgi:hypothetical protein
MNEPFVRPDVRAFLDALKVNSRPAMTAENIAAMRPLARQGMALLERSANWRSCATLSCPVPAGR